MATKKAAETAVAEPVVVEAPVAAAEPAPTAVPPAEVPVAQVPVAVVPADHQPETVVLTETTPPPHQVIVVDAPVPPRKKGNRGLGVGLALVATVIFAALLVAVGFVLSIIAGEGIGFLTQPAFYLPAVAFFVGLVLVTVVLNRAGWWSHIIGSVVVGLVTWLGGASLALLAAGMFSMNQTEANATFYAALFSPILIIAGLLGREVSIWTGAILARRGRSLKVRNAEAQAAYEREQAELTPTVQ